MIWESSLILCLLFLLLLVRRPGLSGRNHYRGRPDLGALRSQLEILRKDKEFLAEQNVFLKARAEELASLVASLQRIIDSSVAINSNHSTAVKTSSLPNSSSEEPDIFINPMSDKKILVKSFDRLGDEKKEDLPDGEVDKLRKILGKKRG